MNWKTWLRGLIAAIVSGASSAVSAMVVDPTAFNTSDLSKLGKVALASAIIGAVFYLKQSPIPPEDATVNSGSAPAPKLPLSIGYFFLLAMAASGLTGCVSPSRLARDLSKDGATISINVTTIYGTMHIFRSNPLNNTVNVNPDGTFTITPAPTHPLPAGEGRVRESGASGVALP